MLESMKGYHIKLIDTCNTWTPVTMCLSCFALNSYSLLLLSSYFRLKLPTPLTVFCIASVQLMSAHVHVCILKINTILISTLS